MNFLFILGRTPQLSQAEIKAVLGLLSVNYQLVSASDSFVIISTDDQLDPRVVMERLGGTVKIAQGIAGCRLSGQLSDWLVDRVTSELCLRSSTDKTKKIIFGISVIGVTKGVIEVDVIDGQIKSFLKKEGFKSRFIKGSDQEQLSSVQVSKQQVIDFVCLLEGDQVHLGLTQVAQDFAKWAARDWNRPFADPHKGMLPPKVARMMLNIGLWHRFKGRYEGETPLLLDPFCGSGTILAEGLMLGCEVVGCDIESRAVNHSIANLRWLVNEFPLSQAKFDVFVHDSTKLISSHVKKVDLLVTEPPLGPPLTRSPSIHQLEDIIKNLNLLYASFLAAQQDTLAANGVVVMTLPLFSVEKDHRVGTSLIDNCEKFGYTLQEGPFIYARPKAIVAREIIVLKKTNS